MTPECPPTAPASIRRSLLFALLERYVSTGIQFASSVVIARLLTPAEVGVFSVATSIFLIIQNMRDLGMTQYIIQETDLTEERYDTATSLTVLLSLGFAAVVWLGSGSIAAFYREPGLVPVLQLLAVSLVVAPLSSPAVARLQRHMEFALLCRIGIATAAVNAVVVIFLAARGASYLSLAWGSLASSLVRLVLVCWFRWADARLRLRLTEWRRVLPFGFQSTLASLSSALGTQAANLIVPRYLTFTAVGLYVRAQGTVALFNRDIGTTVYRVLLPGFASAHRAGGDLKEAYLKSVTYMTGVTWPFYGVLALTAEPLIRVLFGPAWVEAAPIAAMLCLSAAIYAIWLTSTQVIMGLGHVRKILTGELVMQPVRVLLILVATQWGLMAVAGAQVATMVLGGAIYLGYLCPLLRISFRDIVRSTGRSALVTACTLIPAALAMQAGFHRLTFLPLTLFLVAMVSTSAWLAAILGTRHPLKREVLAALEWCLSRGRWRASARA
jgi:O-antigen/teichoic acid export membrane protein